MIDKTIQVSDNLPIAHSDENENGANQISITDLVTKNKFISESWCTPIVRESLIGIMNLNDLQAKGLHAETQNSCARCDRIVKNSYLSFPDLNSEEILRLPKLNDPYFLLQLYPGVEQALMESEFESAENFFNLVYHEVSRFFDGVLRRDATIWSIIPTSQIWRLANILITLNQRNLFQIIRNMFDCLVKVIVIVPEENRVEHMSVNVLNPIEHALFS